MVGAWLFDLDGTLVDSEALNAEALAVVLGEEGRVVDPARPTASISDAERRFVVGHGWREIYRLLVDNGGVELSFDALMGRTSAAKERLCGQRGLQCSPALSSSSPG